MDGYGVVWCGIYEDDVVDCYDYVLRGVRAWMECVNG